MRSKLQKAGLIGIGVVAGILLSLQFQAVAQRVGKSPLPIEEIQAFSQVFEAIKQAYVEPVEDKKLMSGAISGMISDLDPHSAYLDQDAFKELQSSTQGEFGGLGIEVGTEDGYVKVVSPIEGTPADRAGLKAGDLITKIDDTNVKGLNLSDAVKRMRGKPNTKIVLTIARKGENKPIVVTLTREVIKVQSVRAKLTEPGYGYVRITQFQERTIDDLVRYLNTIYKDGALKGLVVDLRNDPGGLLYGAVGVSAAFIEPKQLVVYTEGRQEDAKRKYFAIPEDYVGRRASEDPLAKLPAGVKNVPMVVLVNAGSASASEIVAGALQDYKRATIMGTQTFGKGSVQTILPLTNQTAIKLTTARYYTPSGRSIQAKGIVPDWIVEETEKGPRGPARMREADLEKHLRNNKDAEAPKSEANKDAGKDKELTEEEKAELQKRIEPGSKEDFQFQQAMNFLKGQPFKGDKPVDKPQQTAATKK
jgi:carboxyl-terminal processing protease